MCVVVGQRVPSSIGFAGCDEPRSYIRVVAIRPGDVISHAEMCQAERMMLQAGMNFRPSGRRSIILMSLRKGAPYADRIENGGRTLIY